MAKEKVNHRREVWDTRGSGNSEKPKKQKIKDNIQVSLNRYRL